LEQGRRAKLDIEERRHFAQMLRGYRATLAMELRTFNESVIDRRAHMEGAIAENYGPAGVPSAGLLCRPTARAAPTAGRLRLRRCPAGETV